MRTIVDLPDRQVEALERICRSRNLSRTELIRQAVDHYLQEHLPVRDQAFGLWKREGLARGWSRFPAAPAQGVEALRALFDTNILIDYLNGVEAAKAEIALYKSP